MADRRRRGGPPPPPVTPSVTAAQTAVAVAAPEQVEEIREGPLNNRTAIIAAIAVLGIVAVVLLAYTAWPAEDARTAAEAARAMPPICADAEDVVVPVSEEVWYVQMNPNCLSGKIIVPLTHRLDGLAEANQGMGIVFHEGDYVAGHYWLEPSSTPNFERHRAIFRVYGKGRFVLKLRPKPMPRALAASWWNDPGYPGVPARPSSPPPPPPATVDFVEPVCADAQEFAPPVPANEDPVEFRISLRPDCWSGVIVTPPDFRQGTMQAESTTPVSIALSSGDLLEIPESGDWKFRGQRIFRAKGEGLLVILLEGRTAAPLPAAEPPARGVPDSALPRRQARRGHSHAPGSDGEWLHRTMEEALTVRR